jgi:hypothetical protein
VNFEEYLLSKKIDARAFQAAEPMLYENWKHDFQQMHPNSFTVQKLNLINPIRRKYQSKKIELPKVEVPVEKHVPTPAVVVDTVVTAAPKPARPMMKPKPKIS